nr:hypothetical protein [Tanacetum cinerariifolium]
MKGRGAVGVDWNEMEYGLYKVADRCVRTLKKLQSSIWISAGITPPLRVTWGQRLGGNKPPADMETLHPTDADLLGTGAKYQEDQTQPSRLRYQSLTENEGEPSYKGEPDTQPMILFVQMFEPFFSLRMRPKKGDKLSSSTAHPKASDTDSSSDNILKKILGLERAQPHIKSSMYSLQEDTGSIKSIMTEMYNAFRGKSSLAPSSNVTPTFALSDTLTNVEGENATHTATKEPPSHTEGDTNANIQEKLEEPKME